ncbi:MAG TPA: tetratricopeptide repeat protein [Chitinophagales bacterium]|nr:tetratricopeptide repeat protein [Chitinophagales bacterium]
MFKKILWIKKVGLLLLLWLTVTTVNAQSQQDVQLALEYFKNAEFDKAVVLYEKLYNKAPGNTLFFQNYIQSLAALKQYGEAEKVIKKQLKKFPDDLTFYVDLGNIYHLQGDDKAATAQYDEAIRQITPDMPMVNKLAYKFQSAALNDYAIQSYQKARKVFNAENSDLFLSELASLYRKQNDVSDAVKAYLDIVDYNPSMSDDVEGQLQPLIESADYARELQSELYRRIQKKSDNEVFAEMLIWYFIQKKDFTAAFQQVKALDKRNKEEGQRVFQFAQSAFDEGNYESALTAYRYIINEKGKNSFLYLPARTSELTTEKTKITVQHTYTPEELTKLENSYESYFTEFGKGAQTILTMRDYASLEAKYLHNIDKAIAIAQEAVNIPTNEKKLAGYLKMDLGDYNLIKNEVWEATLLYSQVDKAFKEDELGEEARFKNAQLSFYMGDFPWSQAQLDVLKGSTSELVANDALSLSVFMTDNMGLDTSTVPMEMYSRADLLIFQNKFEAALQTLDSITAAFPENSLADDVLFSKGRIYLAKQNYAEAAALFDQLDKNYSTDLLADDALFQLAELYEDYLNNKDKAMELYKDILLKYKGSIYVVEARKRFRELRGDELN